ncbi:hypothetical protein Pmani_038616 [Petrolisthes manimaculis]|uniref:Uncharacterized protein n=1 Tax=Petrolisthes manimaculis TaxID=1843537 RepID=A0AAE1NE27_9EUCA|nr:hypothetical protein Pmani_038616 [Petrolisthes manimaculis]
MAIESMHSSLRRCDFWRGIPVGLLVILNIQYCMSRPMVAGISPTWFGSVHRRQYSQPSLTRSGGGWTFMTAWMLH